MLDSELESYVKVCFRPISLPVKDMNLFICIHIIYIECFKIYLNINDIRYPIR